MTSYYDSDGWLVPRGLVTERDGKFWRGDKEVTIDPPPPPWSRAIMSAREDIYDTAGFESYEIIDSLIKQTLIDAADLIRHEVMGDELCAAIIDPASESFMLGGN